MEFLDRAGKIRRRARLTALASALACQQPTEDVLQVGRATEVVSMLLLTSDMRSAAR